MLGRSLLLYLYAPTLTLPRMRPACGGGDAPAELAEKIVNQTTATTATTTTSTITVAGIRIEMIERGAGRPLLFLHPGIGIEPDRAGARPRWPRARA